MLRRTAQRCRIIVGLQRGRLALEVDTGTNHELYMLLELLYDDLFHRI